MKPHIRILIFILLLLMAFTSGCTSPTPSRGGNGSAQTTRTEESQGIITGSPSGGVEVAEQTLNRFFDDANNERYGSLAGYLLFPTSNASLKDQYQNQTVQSLEKNWGESNLRITDVTITSREHLKDPCQLGSGDEWRNYCRDHITEAYVFRVSLTAHRYSPANQSMGETKTGTPFYLFYTDGEWNIMLPED
jgi:hypothetical protein